MKRLIVLVFIWTAVAAKPQFGDLSWRTLYPEEVEKDLNILFSTLEECHPDLYRFTDKGHLEHIKDSIRSSVNGPKSEWQLIQTLRSLVVAIGDPELEMRPSDELRDRARESALMLPLKVKVYDEGLFVEDELKGHQSLLPGSRIFFINGVSDDDIMARMMHNLVAVGQNRTLKYRTIDAHFPELFYDYVDQSQEFEIYYEDPDGDLHKTVLGGLTLQDMEVGKVAETRKMEGISYSFDALTLSGYLRVPTFDAEVLKKTGKDPSKIYKYFFSALRKNEFKVAFIDLRGNAGGNSYEAEKLYSYIADRRFRAERDIWVSSKKEPTFYNYTSKPDKFYKELRADYVGNLSGNYAINSRHFSLEHVDPNKDAFAGQVFVLIDGGTRNAGAIPAILGKAHNRVTLVGEEGGSNAMSSTGGQKLRLTLPNSGIKFDIPLQKLLYDVDLQQPTTRGLLVDRYVEQHPHDLIKGTDSAYEAVHRTLTKHSSATFTP